MDTLNIQQAADVLKVHPNTVERLINEGVIPAAKVGRAWVMMTAHVMKYLENEIIQQTAARRGIPAPKPVMPKRKEHPDAPRQEKAVRRRG